MGATVGEWVSYLKSIAIAGLIFWFLIVATLQLCGVVDLRVQCPWCIDLLPQIIHEGYARPINDLIIIPPVPHFQPLKVTIVVLPGLVK